MRGSSHGKSTSMHSRERASLRLGLYAPSAHISLQNDHVKILISSSTCFNDHASPTMLASPERDSVPPRLPTSYAKTRKCTHVFRPNCQTVHGAANLASWAREAASPARAGQIEGQDLPSGDLSRGIPAPDLDVQPLVCIEACLVTEGSQSRLLLVEEDHPV